jgi:hypothetical protein
MSTYNAFYVRRQGSDDATRGAIAGLYPKAKVQMLPEFVGAILSRNDMEPPEQKLKELSASLRTDVIWVTFQTTAESFIFHHWREGEQLRVLWYGCAEEGVWGRAEGQVEPWEADEFWSEEPLEAALECAETESEQGKLRRLWKDRVIRKGQTDPSVSSEDAVLAVMEHYGLFNDDAPLSQSSSTQSNKKGKSKSGYGCLVVLLLIVAFVVFAIIGVVAVIKKIL